MSYQFLIKFIEGECLITATLTMKLPRTLQYFIYSLQGCSEASKYFNMLHLFKYEFKIVLSLKSSAAAGFVLNSSAFK